LWTVWLGAIPQFIGGFSSVGPALIYTMIADVTAQAERATMFFRLMAAFLLAELIASPFGGFMLDVHPWLALLLCPVLLAFSMVTVVLMPETLDLVKMADARRLSGDLPRESSDEEGAVIAKAPWWRKIGRTLKENTVDTYRFLIANKPVAVLMTSVAFIAIGRFVQEVLLQYATKRYNMSWSKASAQPGLHQAGTVY
jgi:MFS family permease